MRMLFRPLLTMTMIVVCSTKSFPQTTPVLSLRNGNAFLYRSIGNSAAQGHWDSTHTNTILHNVFIDDKLFFISNDFVFGYSDTTMLVLDGDTLCDFRWSIGDTVHLEGSKWVVLEKGASTYFSESQPYMKLASSPYYSRTIFKKFGIVDFTYDSLSSQGTIDLIGARINGTIYGSAPTLVSQSANTQTNAALIVYPNPSSGPINLQISLPQSNDLSIEIFNVLGQRISTIYNGQHHAGVSVISFNNGLENHNLATGIYFIHLRSGTNLIQRRIMVIK